MKTVFNSLFTTEESLFLLLVAALHPGFSYSLPENKFKNTELFSEKMDRKKSTIPCNSNDPIQNPKS